MTDTLDVFEWDELPELSDLTLVSYAPLQTLLRSIIHRINDHSRYLKDEKAKAKRVTEQQRDNESTTQVKPLDGSNDGGEGGGGAVDSDDGSKQQRGGEDNQMREDDSAVAEMNDQSMLLENQRTVDSEREDVVQHGVGDGGGETEKDMDTTATRQQQQDGAKSVDGSGSLPVVSSDEARTAMNDKLEEMTSALQKMDDSSRELKRQVEQLQRQLAEQQQQLTQQQQQLQDQKHQQQQQQIQPQPLLLPVAQQYDSQEQDRIPQQQQQQLLQQTQLQQQQQQQQIQQQGEDIKQLKDQNEKLNSKIDDIDGMRKTVDGLEQKLKDALSSLINDRLKDERQGWDDRFNRLTNSITAPSLLTANTNRPVTPPLSSNSKATSELQDAKSKRSEETLNSTAMLEPILKDMSKLVTRDELDNMMKEVREKTDTASDRSQALDDKLMKKFKDLVTYIDSMKEQLKREMRALANSSTGTSSSPEPSDNNNGRASPNLSEHSFPLRNSITKKRSDDPLRRSRAGTLPKDGTLDAMNSPVASRREGDDMLRTISPLDKTPLDKSIMDKLASKADQHLVQALQQKIDEMFDRLGQIDQAVDQKANKQTAATIEQVKDLEAKLRRKTDREEVTSMMERMAQESNNNNNSLHLGSPQTGDGTAGGGDKSGVAGQVLLEGEDFNRIREAINKQASTLQQLVKQKADKTEVAKQMSEKMEHIEHLDQTKADANIVARKAEREYVDNMFDRLRKELLQYVENATNSTADLFAKDLAMLQGIIEDKASRNDLRKIREVLSSSQKEDPSGEGLAGKKAYRCLSCNRSMAGMRVKPLSMNFTSFVNHLPNSKNRMYAKKSILNDSITQTRSSKEQLSPQNSGMDMSLPPVDSLMMDTSDLGANGRTSSSPGDGKTSPSGRQSREESRLPSINEHRESLK